MSDKGLVKPCERLDDLGRDGLFLIQNPEYFCFGIDAVLLSDFTRVYSGESVMDLCTGNGIIPVLLSAKTRAEKIYGLEIQPELADLAKRSVQYNDLAPKIEIIEGDLCKIADYLPAHSLDVVTVNPPYMHGGGNNGEVNEKEALKIARHEVLCNFEDVIRAASYLLRSKGRMYIVHRPLRLVEILRRMSEYKIEPKSLRFVHPYAEKEPNMVLIEGIKDAGAEIRVAPPLVVYKEKNVYTEEILKIYGKS